MHGGDKGVKLLALVSLVAVQSGGALLFKASQSAGGAYAYSPGGAQAAAEAIKLVLSAVFFAREHARSGGGGGNGAAARAFVAQMRHPRLLAHYAGLALLYLFINQVHFTLYAWSDAASVALVKCSSTLVTALLLWGALARPVSPLQWTAIAQQACGLFVVQYDACAGAPLLAGRVYAALFACVAASSAAGVWNEALLKSRALPSLHAQNACLYAAGVALNLAVFAAEGPVSGGGDGPPRKRGLLEGYTPAALGLVASQALLGLVVVAVLKYADAVIRMLGNACSVALLYAYNVARLGWVPNPTYLAGCIVVVASSYSYVAAAAPTMEPECKPEADAAGAKAPPAAGGELPHHAAPAGPPSAYGAAARRGAVAAIALLSALILLSIAAGGAARGADALAPAAA
jgi:UDP-sugar transporter A1/2/3